MKVWLWLREDSDGGALVEGLFTDREKAEAFFERHVLGRAPEEGGPQKVTRVDDLTAPTLSTAGEGGGEFTELRWVAGHDAEDGDTFECDAWTLQEREVH